MSELLKANSELLKRQQRNGAPKAIADLATAVLNTTTNEPPLRIPATEQKKGRVVQRASLKDLDKRHPLVLAAVEMVYLWAERKRNGHDDASLVLVGPYGTGKTHIARAVLWSMALYDNGVPVAALGAFRTGNDLIQSLNGETSFQTILNYRSVWDSIEQKMVMSPPPIVVIDDVGSEKFIPFIGAQPENQRAETQARYFDVINHCYQKRISLVITSNLSLEQLRDHVGGRCWDRLSEMAPKGFMIDLTGVPSWRQKVSGR